MKKEFTIFNNKKFLRELLVVEREVLEIYPDGYAVWGLRVAAGGGSSLISCYSEGNVDDVIDDIIEAYPHIAEEIKKFLS